MPDLDLLRRYGAALLAHEANPMPTERRDDGSLTFRGQRVAQARAVTGKALRKVERELQAKARKLASR